MASVGPPVAETLAAQASELAVLLDFDGTLAPIVDNPNAAAPDSIAAQAVRSLAAHLPLVGCVTGRPALQARDLLGVDAIAYSGLHGAQWLAAGAAQPQTPEAFVRDGALVHQLVDQARTEPQGLAGLTVEHKGSIVALHWRTAADPQAASGRARELAIRAQERGLSAGEGRSVIELRPALKFTKGDAVGAMLEGHDEVRHVLFAGDDVTDLDAFGRLRQLVAEGRLSGVTLVAVAGDDAPPEVAAAADLVVEGPAALGTLLAELARSAGADAGAGTTAAQAR